MTAGRYQVQPPLPFVPGLEFAGRVVQLGPGVADRSVGDRVVGNVSYGAYAQYVEVPATSTLRVPEAVSLEDAAAMLLTYGTAKHALEDRGGLAPGETLLVLGAAGGVGTAAVQVGKATGARVLAAVSSEDKAEHCRRQGADEIIFYDRDDLKSRVRELTDGRGADVVFDPVGGMRTEPALRATAWGGRLLVVGFASGTIPRLPANLLLLKGNDVRGVYWGAFVKRQPERHRQHVGELFRWLEAGRVRVHVDDILPLEAAAEALDRLRQRRVRGKVLLRPPL